MKKTLTAFALVLFTAATASASPINFGFETGDLTGWLTATPGGQAAVATIFDDGDGPTYLPNEGSYFLVIESGNEDEPQVTSQPFAMLAGETIYGAAAFTTLEAIGLDCCLNDIATATIFEVLGATLTEVWSAHVTGAGGVGQFGSTPWEYWAFSAPNSGTYIITYSVQNTGDNLYNSYALFDAATAAQVPDGGSALALLGLGMIGLSTLRRKLF